MPAVAVLLLAHLAALLPGPVQSEDAPTGPVTVFRVDRIETLDGEAVSNATLVVRNGVIEKMGQAVVIPKGAKVHDLRGSGATLMPPLVLSHANFLQRDARGVGSYGRYRAIDSLYLNEDDLPDLLEEGILLVGVDPPGAGIPGRTSVLTTDGDHPRPTALVNDLHLKLTFQASGSFKSRIRKALKDADAAIKAEDKARAEWEKARKEWEEKQKQKQKQTQKAAEGKQEKKEGDKEEQGEKGKGRPGRLQDEEKQQKKNGEPQEKAPPETFEPPKIDPNLKPVVDWVRNERVAQVWLNSGAAWLHWKDVLGERELPFEVSLIHSFQTSSLHEVVEDLSDGGMRVYLPARICFLPDTRTRANLPAEYAAAGAQIVLRPADNGMTGVRQWRQGVADVVREGLGREVALKAMTIEPAAAMGQEELIQPIKAGGPANFIVLNGDPLDPTSKTEFVIRDGKVLFDRSSEEQERSR